MALLEAGPFLLPAAHGYALSAATEQRLLPRRAVGHLCPASPAPPPSSLPLLLRQTTLEGGRLRSNCQPAGAVPAAASAARAAAATARPCGSPGLGACRGRLLGPAACTWAMPAGQGAPAMQPAASTCSTLCAATRSWALQLAAGWQRKSAAPATACPRSTQACRQVWRLPTCLPAPQPQRLNSTGRRRGRPTRHCTARRAGRQAAPMRQSSWRALWALTPSWRTSPVPRPCRVTSHGQTTAARSRLKQPAAARWEGQLCGLACLLVALTAGPHAPAQRQSPATAGAQLGL